MGALDIVWLGTSWLELKDITASGGRFVGVDEHGAAGEPVTTLTGEGLDLDRRRTSASGRPSGRRRAAAVAPGRGSRTRVRRPRARASDRPSPIARATANLYDQLSLGPDTTAKGESPPVPPADRAAMGRRSSRNIPVPVAVGANGAEVGRLPGSRIRCPALMRPGAFTWVDHEGASGRPTALFATRRLRDARDREVSGRG